MSAGNNKWLVVRRGVILTPSIEPVIVELDGYFEAVQLIAYVTDGLRTRKDQIELIRRKALRHSLQNIYLDLETANLEQIVAAGKQNQPYWQILWSQLLSIGELINPPEPAIAEFDYIHPKRGHIPAGHLVGTSPHFKGTSFDVGGGKDGISQEVAVLEGAIERVHGLLDITPEPMNNAIHCDCRLVT